MKITLNIPNIENLPSSPNTDHYSEIITALISSGGLDGVKSGKTIIHFDAFGMFQSIQLDYFPYKRRSPQKD